MPFYNAAHRTGWLATTCAVRTASSVPDTHRASGDRQAQIAATARSLLDAEGPQALTMRRIGGALGIKASAAASG